MDAERSAAQSGWSAGSNPFAFPVPTRQQPNAPFHGHIKWGPRRPHSPLHRPLVPSSRNPSPFPTSPPVPSSYGAALLDTEYEARRRGVVLVGAAREECTAGEAHGLTPACIPRGAAGALHHCAADVALPGRVVQHWRRHGKELLGAGHPHAMSRRPPPSRVARSPARRAWPRS